MTDETVYVLADAHIGEVSPAVALALHRFVDSVPAAGDHLVINGDLFSFWFEYGAVIPHAAFPTLARLAAMRQRGVRLTVTGGNHDRWDRGFWRRALDADFHPEGTELTLAGWRAHVGHGDGVAEPDRSQRVLQAITRHPLTRGLFRWIHPDVGYRLVERWSVGRGKARDPEMLDRAAAAQRAWALALLERREDLALVVLGHTHRPALVSVGERRWYVNPGAWTDGFRYAVIGTRGPELRSYPYQ